MPCSPVLTLVASSAWRCAQNVAASREKLSRSSHRQIVGVRSFAIALQVFEMLGGALALAT